MMNRQLPGARKVVEAVRTSFEHVKNNAFEFCGLSWWKNWDTESWKKLISVGKTDWSVIEHRSSCVLCLYGVWVTVTSFRIRHGRQNFLMCGTRHSWTNKITRADWCNCRRTFSGHTALQIKRDIQTFLGSTEPWNFRGRFKVTCLFNDIEHWKPGNEQNCLENGKEAAENRRSNSS